MRLCFGAMLAAGALLLAACGPAPAPEAKKESKAVVKPPDESRRFPSDDRVSLILVDDDLTGKAFMPGGNLAEYRTKSGAYQLFLANTGDAQKAAFLLLDWKDALQDAKYVAHMGGYFGLDNGKPLFVFQKGVFLAGVIGLPEKEADTVARQFAVRLN